MKEEPVVRWRIYRHRLAGGAYGLWSIARGPFCVAHTRTFEEARQAWVDMSERSK